MKTTRIAGFLVLMALMLSASLGYASSGPAPHEKAPPTISQFHHAEVMQAVSVTNLVPATSYVMDVTAHPAIPETATTDASDYANLLLNERDYSPPEKCPTLYLSKNSKVNLCASVWSKGFDTMKFNRLKNSK